jgi:putative membrane protein
MIVAHAGDFELWHAHPDTWLLLALLGGAYALAVTRVGPRFAAPGEPAASRRQVACFALGLGAIWLAADWPIHDVAERSMYSVHMLQHLLLSMVATPLLMLGTPGWLARWVLRPPSVAFRVVRRLSRFVPAVIVFNVVLVLTHWPLVVNASLDHHWLHLWVHVVIMLSAVIVWMPVLSPLPEIPRLAAPVRAAYLFLQSVVPTIPASFLTFGTSPLYKFYVGKVHIWGLSTLEDQQVAGLIMKLGAGILLWMLIAVVFFRLAADEDRHGHPQRLRRELERELAKISTTGVDESVKG